MTGRVAELVEKTETALLLKPEWQKKIVVSLLNFIRIRNDATYRVGLDVLAESAREMQKDPEKEIESDLLLSETEIASVFPLLTKPESKELEDYFISLLMKSGNSLANYLSKTLNGKVEYYWNSNDFLDGKMKYFAVTQSMANADDRNREEDFALKIPDEISHKELFKLIGNYYAGQGFKISEKTSSFSITARTDSKFIIVVVTELERKVFVTVNVLKM